VCFFSVGFAHFSCSRCACLVWGCSSSTPHPCGVSSREV
jgi:hypothetical protein